MATRLRLLPPNHSLGWTPYAWLIYLGFFLIYPVMGHGSIGVWTITLFGVALFLPLYFWGFWAGEREMLVITAAIMVIGVAYAPFNAGASAFFIYAAAFACDVGPPRKAAGVIGIIVGVCLVEAWLFELPPWFWIPASAISIVVGGVNIHWAQRRRDAAKLRKVQDEMAAVAERDRIARDLHDLLGHNLSMIILKSELASKLMERDPARAKAEIVDVERVSRETLGRVREAVSGFRAKGLQDEADLVRSNLESAGIRTTLNFAGASLAAAGETVAALFLREAGTNILRHARASQAWIDIAQTNGMVEIEVRDDGRGGIEEEGFGIRGMRARIEAVGGSFRFESREGTVLHASIPAAGGNA